MRPVLKEKNIELRVAHANRALSLYERLGFTIVAREELHYLMKWNISRRINTP